MLKRGIRKPSHFAQRLYAFFVRLHDGRSFLYTQHRCILSDFALWKGMRYKMLMLDFHGPQKRCVLPVQAEFPRQDYLKPIA